MKNSFRFRLAGLSISMFLFGTMASASEAQVYANIRALINAQQAQQKSAQPAAQIKVYAPAASAVACIPCAPGARPQFSNLDWSDALGQGVKKTLGHAATMFAILKLPSYIAPSWFSGISYEKIASSSAVFLALTILSLRYKKQVMKRFQTEQGCETAIGLTSSFLPGFSKKMLMAATAAATYFAFNGPSY